MANPVDIGLRIVQALDGIGIKAGSFLGKASNVKKAMFGGKSTMFKPNAIQSIRGEGGDFGTALKLIEEEAQYIVNATDAEKMAFLNNLNDYKDLGALVDFSCSCFLRVVIKMNGFLCRGTSSLVLALSSLCPATLLLRNRNHNRNSS